MRGAYINQSVERGAYIKPVGREYINQSVERSIYKTSGEFKLRRAQYSVLKVTMRMKLINSLD